MNVNLKLAAIVAALVLVLPTHAQAGGPYIGIGAGGATLENDADDIVLPVLPGSIDEDDTAFKLFAGYNWELSDVTLGIEGAYTNFGEPDIDTTLGELLIETTGFSLWGVAAIDLGPVELFGKAGLLAWDVEGSIPQFTSSSADGTDVAYGAGVRFTLGDVEVRGELEIYDLDGADLSMLSVGLAYRF